MTECIEIMIFWMFVFLCVSLIVFLNGCTRIRLPLPNGKVVEYDSCWKSASAKKVELYYKDPNTTIWLVINDPNSSVHPGRLNIKEPKTGIEVGLEAY